MQTVFPDPTTPPELFTRERRRRRLRQFLAAFDCQTRTVFAEVPGAAAVTGPSTSDSGDHWTRTNEFSRQS
ncbi:MAG: hypothetical protein FJ399_10445 [Verrucomicrobia bacterium]|nr:hypothetical protein [Verrucomicrobiota bacterium]